MTFDREQQKSALLLVILVAIVAVLAGGRSGSDGGSGSSISSIAKGSDEDKIIFCSRDSGMIPVAGTYTQYNRCLDYLTMVAQGLIDPNVTPPPGTVPTTTTSAVPPNEIRGNTPCPPDVVDPAAPKKTRFELAPGPCIDPTKRYSAVFDTSEGEIRVALNVKTTPVTTNNFVVLSRYKFYDDTRIFRTDPSLDIIQGGGMSNTDGPGYSLFDEGSGYTYSVGDLAMARTSAPNSAGSQWFFVTGPRAAVLNPQGTYVVFGKITSGLRIAQRINSYDAGGRPNKDVVVRTIRIIES